MPVNNSLSRHFLDFISVAWHLYLAFIVGAVKAMGKDTNLPTYVIQSQGLMFTPGTPPIGRI